MTGGSGVDYQKLYFILNSKDYIISVVIIEGYGLAIDSNVIDVKTVEKCIFNT